MPFVAAGAAESGPQDRYRGDIDGLRAISIVAVVLFHAGVDRFAGGYVGVDVFFVISGFLITGLLIREVDRTGSVSMQEFYARRIRRLLPLSFTTIATTLVAGVWLLPPLARERLIDDARYASVYLANWRYAGQATTYSDTEVTDSLLVHYWSLAIEEQFYLLWPILIVAGVWIARRLHRRPGPVLAVLLGVLGVSSFITSVVLTNDRGFGAYYLTHTRLWEMAVGAGLAFAIPLIRRLPRPVPDLIGLSGLAMITFAATTYDETTSFPGSAALVPVLGCGLVLVAGAQAHGLVARALAIAPMRFLGRLSYAWYLWHWPAIGIALLLRDRYDWTIGVGATTALGVGGSFGLAWVSHHLIENPVRHSSRLRGRPRRNFAVGAALTFAPLVIGAVLLATVDRGDTEIVLDDGLKLQSPAEAAADEILSDPSCHMSFAGVDTPPQCVFGDPDGDITVVLLGDSHARQWLDAFDLLGQREGWRIVSWTKSACSIIDVDIYLPALEKPYNECTEWRDNVVRSTAELGGADVVVLARSAGSRRHVMVGDEVLDESAIGPTWQAGFQRTVTAFTAIADKVVITTDTPWPGFAPPECLASNPGDIAACSFDLTTSIRDSVLLAVERPVAESAGVRFVDSAALVCTVDPCSVVADDGTILYRDSHHLTRTYTLSLLDELAGWVTD